MKEVITYSDYKNRPTRLTDAELDWFHGQVEKAKEATGYDVQIIAYDHELYEGIHKEALGCCVTTDPENQLGEGVDTYITIDCFFIDECWRHEFKGDYFFSDSTLLETIAHELAHLKYWNHGKRHAAMTEKLLRQIEAA